MKKDWIKDIEDRVLKSLNHSSHLPPTVNTPPHHTTREAVSQTCGVLATAPTMIITRSISRSHAVEVKLNYDSLWRKNL